MYDAMFKAVPIVFSLDSILLALLGTGLGIITGAMPGLSATMGVALLIPITFGMEPAYGLILLGGIYCGAIYGGSISAILLRVPGTPSSVATTYDGFPMTQKGEADKALKISITASFTGGIISAAILLFMAPPLARVALMFGASEYFWLALLGLSVIVSLSSANLIKGFLAAAFGLFVGAIGLDPLTGVPRFTFGIPNLLDGVPIIVFLIGLYSIPQALEMIETETVNKVPEMIQRGTACKFREIWHEIVHICWPTYIRSSILGTIIGIIPGAGGDIASFLGYEQGKRFSKHQEKFGTGWSEGVAASEAANNGVTGGSLVPMLTLGIPGNAVSAVMLGGLLIHGLQPGPRLFAQRPDVVYTFMIALFLVNAIMLFLGYFGSYLYAKVVKVPYSIVGPLVITLSVVGSYAIKNSMFDVGLMLLVGFIGYIMRKLAIEAGPAVLALILGPMAEENWRRAMLISGGDVTYVFTGVLNWFLIILFVIVLLFGIRTFIKRKNEVEEFQADT